MARIIVTEVCPQCGSFDVRASEPAWFRVEWERRAELDPPWVDGLEFACRECGLVWE
ncbi:hypothetical protein [Microbacterium timonense]|uniref:hypothetical protein n=1 Tax=Microbacterium timonense TaxID=2086576 RepID=UPI0013594EC9|nr:hypothetical protein [Microbacterium timonense]